MRKYVVTSIWIGVLSSLCSISQASMSKIIKTEAKSIIMDPQRVTIECKPGRTGNIYPTASALIINGLKPLLWKNSNMDYLVYNSKDNQINCENLLKEFSFIASLPTVLTVTRTLYEDCYDDESGQDRIHKRKYWEFHGNLLDHWLGGESEILSDEWIENGSCS